MLRRKPIADKLLPFIDGAAVFLLDEREVRSWPLDGFGGHGWPSFSVVVGASFEGILEVALILHETLDALGMPNHAKTTGSRGIHVYVPIVRGPTQKQVWAFAKTLAGELARRHPRLITAVYKKALRPTGHVLVDYNQNAWGRTLASVYSVRPTPRASVSAPLTWDEVARGMAIDDFRLDNVPARLARVGDLWSPLLAASPRVDLSKVSA